MKMLIVRCSIAFALVTIASLAFAGQFKSKIITTQTLVITVPDDHFIKITNFTQQGGAERGVVEVTLQGSDTDTSGTANVLTATRVDQSSGGSSQNFPEVSNRVIIAGPAEVRIRPVANATLLITYRKEHNEGGGGGGGGGVTASPTPIIIFSPTPVPTATPTPGF